MYQEITPGAAETGAKKNSALDMTRNHHNLKKWKKGKKTKTFKKNKGMKAKQEKQSLDCAGTEYLISWEEARQQRERRA